ncbi:MAG: hypothetical protein GXP17_02430 [Gammaproteobacteria bacterium]|nr:hypothetical protein [Gammaproteobacteria bacterium]
MKKIINNKPAIEGSYIKIVFFRSDRVKDDVSLYDWVCLTVLEFMFGEELLEQFIITSAYNEEAKKTGHFLHLTDMVPAGILTNYFRHKICQLLYYKYYKHYIFLASEGTINENEIIDKTGNALNLSRYRFAMRHDLLYQIIAFRRVYILQWIAFNLSVDTILYLSIDLQAALLSALTIEGVRRALRL